MPKIRFLNIWKYNNTCVHPHFNYKGHKCIFFNVLLFSKRRLAALLLVQVLIGL